jgi:hypothetical protein
MLSFDSVLQQIHAMYEAGPPPCKTFTLKNSRISNQPDIPTSHDHHLHEKRVPKTSFGLNNEGLQVHIVVASPINLPVVPYPSAEIALKKQMNSIFISSNRT